MRSTTLPLALAWALAAVPVAGQSFGNSVLLHDGDVLVGEPTHELRSGLVWTFRRGADGTWEEAGRLEAPDATPGDRFGIRMAADGDLLLVSATRADDGAGAVYLFRRGDGEWRSEGRLTVSDRSPADSLGSGLAVDGDWILVGSIARAEGRGMVFAFRREGDTWVEHSRFAPAGLQAEDRFGTNVALENGVALVSAPARKDGEGAVWAYHYDEDSDAWVEAGAVASTLTAARAGFGSSLALHDGTALVGAPGLNTGMGAVFTFRWAEDAGAFRAGSVLLPVEAGRGTQFGVSLAWDDGTLWVGAPGAAGFQGRAWAYRYDADRGEWVGAAMTAPDSLGRGDFFGAGLAARGSLAVASALGEDYGAGTAYVLERGPDGWSVAAKLASPPATVAAITGDEVRCDPDGRAALFGCADVDLLSFLPVGEMGADRGVRTNDVWGWTDPQTGRDIAIVGMTDQTAFVDVSDAYHPVYLGRLPKTPAARGSTWRDMKVYKDHVFVVSDGAGPHGMQVFDLTRLRGLDGSAPETFTEDAHYDRVNSAHNIVINEETGFAYIVGASGGGETCGGGLHMVNIQDPLHPAFAGCFSDPTTGRSRTGYSHDAQCVSYHGPDEDYRGREICLGSNETALSIADVTDKQHPVAVAMATYPNVGYSHQGWLSEDHAWFFMNDELDETGGLVPSTRTLVWDLADLDDPVLAKEYFSDNHSSDHNLYIVGTTMYQSNYVSGLRVFDISDPENPRPVGYFDTVPYGPDAPGFNGSWSNYPFFESGVVVVTSGREGLFLVRPRSRNLIP